MLNKLSGKFGKILLGMAAVSTIATSTSAINNNLFANETDKVEVEQKNTQGDSRLFSRRFYNDYVKEPVAKDRSNEVGCCNLVGAGAINLDKIPKEDKCTALVNTELTTALERSGIPKSKIVYNIQELYPMAAGEEFATMNWTQLNRNDPSTYMLAKNPNIVVQYAEFNRTTDQIKLITKTHDKGQEIVMKNGVVIRDTGLYNIDR